MIRMILVWVLSLVVPVVCSGADWSVCTSNKWFDNSTEPLEYVGGYYSSNADRSVVGIILGNALVRVIDDGTHYELLPLPPGEPTLTASSLFVMNGHLFNQWKSKVNWTRHKFATYIDTGWVEHFPYRDLPLDQNVFIPLVYVDSLGHIISVSEDSSEVVVSNDGGETWAHYPFPDRFVVSGGASHISDTTFGLISDSGMKVIDWNTMQQLSLIQLAGNDAGLYAIAPSTYISTLSNRGGEKLHRTTDNGQTWTSLEELPSMDSLDWYQRVHDSLTYVLFRSDVWYTVDQGNTWKKKGNLGLRTIGLWKNGILPARDGNGFMVATDAGLWRIPADVNESIEHMIDSAPVPAHGYIDFTDSIALAVCRNTLLRTTDAGRTWYEWIPDEAADLGEYNYGAQTQSTPAITVDTAGRLLGWSDMLMDYDRVVKHWKIVKPVPQFQSGFWEVYYGRHTVELLRDVYVGLDSRIVGGAFQNRVVMGTYDQQEPQVLLDESTQYQTLYASTYRYQGQLCAVVLSIDTAIRLTANGAEWYQPTGLPGKAIPQCISSTSTGTLVMGLRGAILDSASEEKDVFFSGGIHRSGDEGRTWSSVSANLPEMNSIVRLCVLPSGTLLAHARHRRFDKVPTGAGDLKFTVSLPSILRSTDDGVTWNVVHEQFYSGFDNAETGFILYAQTDCKIYSGMFGRILTSIDDGATWQDLDIPGPIGKMILDAAEDVQKNVLYVSTDTAVYALPLEGATGVDDAPSVEHLHTEVYAFPNPAVAGINIHVVNLHLAPEAVSMTIIRASTGELVQDVSRELEARMQEPRIELSVDLSDVPEGAYVVCLKSGKRTYMSKFTIVQ